MINSGKIARIVLGLMCMGIILILGCGEEEREVRGRVIKIDYSDVDIKSEDWVRIDSFTFNHVGRREEAKAVDFPLPSKKVFVDSARGRAFNREYNSKTIAMYVANHLNRINDSLPKEKRFKITNYPLLSYRGIMTIIKEDSSFISVSYSEGYESIIESNDGS